MNTVKEYEAARQSLLGYSAATAAWRERESQIQSRAAWWHETETNAPAPVFQELTVPAGLPVLLDGGVRTGTDVFRALALGARAVLLGRPVLWGLAHSGAAGAGAVLRLLREELEECMVLAGRPTLADIDPSAVRVRPA